MNNNTFLKSNIESISKNKSKATYDINKSNFDNTPKEITYFGDNYFLGIDTYNPPSQLQVGYFLLLLNCIPNFNKLTSCWGYEVLGTHTKNDPVNLSPDDFKIIHIGEMYSRQTLGASFGEIVKIVKHKIKGYTRVYKLSEDNSWENISPIDSSGEIYNFLSEDLSDTTWKNSYYIVSGKEQFTTKQIQKTIDSNTGLATGNQIIEVSGNVLKYNIKGVNQTSWSAIKTGAAGYLDNIFTNVSIYDTNGNIIQEKINFKDQAIQFNPSLILARKGRSYIAGSLANDVQVKVSEFDNLDNFTDNILQGVNSAVLTASDAQRSSTFIATLQNDKITSLLEYNDKTLIGTELGWYEHDLVQGKTISGQFTLYDQINKIPSADCGTINSKSVCKYSGSILYLGRINGRNSLCELKAVSSGSGSYYQFYNRSSKIQKILDNIDINNSVITQKEDYFIISTVYGCNEDSKFIQICGYQYNDKNSVNYNFFLTDYINATRFYSSQFGVYFGNNNTGDLFVIKKQEDPILDRKGLSVSKPIASIISGLTGYEKAKTSHLLTKNLASFNSSGTFEDKTEIETIVNDYKSDICILNHKELVNQHNLIYKDFINNMTYISDDNLKHLKFANYGIRNFYEYEKKKVIKESDTNSYKSCYYTINISNYGNYFEMYKNIFYSQITKLKL